MTLWETLVFLANLYGEVPQNVIVVAAVLPCAAQALLISGLLKEHVCLLSAGARGHAGNGVFQVSVMLFVFVALRMATVFSAECNDAIVDPPKLCDHMSRTGVERFVRLNAQATIWDMAGLPLLALAALTNYITATHGRRYMEQLVSLALLEQPTEELARTWELREFPEMRTRLVP
jgi:uncharacterized membrane protein